MYIIQYDIDYMSTCLLLTLILPMSNSANLCTDMEVNTLPGTCNKDRAQAVYFLLKQKIDLRTIRVLYQV